MLLRFYFAFVVVIMVITFVRVILYIYKYCGGFRKWTCGSGVP